MVTTGVVMASRTVTARAFCAVLRLRSAEPTEESALLSRATLLHDDVALGDDPEKLTSHSAHGQTGDAVVDEDPGDVP